MTLLPISACLWAVVGAGWLIVRVGDWLRRPNHGIGDLPLPYVPKPNDRAIWDQVKAQAWDQVKAQV